MALIRTLIFSLLVFLRSIPQIHAQPEETNKVQKRLELMAWIASGILIPVGIIAVICGVKKRNKKIRFQNKIINATETLASLQNDVPHYVQMTDEQLQGFLIAQRPYCAYTNLEAINALNTKDNILIWHTKCLKNDNTNGTTEIINAMRNRIQELKIRIAGLPATQKERELVAQKELIPPAPVTNNYTYVTQPRPAVVHVEPHVSWVNRNSGYTYHYDRDHGSSYTVTY